MIGAWLISLTHLAWQVVVVLLFGGSWLFVSLAVVFVLAVAAIDLPRRMSRA